MTRLTHALGACALAFLVVAPGLASPAEASTKVPHQMSAPTVQTDSTHRNHRLTVAWVAPKERGPQITSYVVDASPGGRHTAKSTTRKATFDDLTNGTAYRFRIRAYNSRGHGSWSAWSAPATPFKKPSAPSSAVLAVDPPAFGGGAHVSVSWTAADASGDPEGIKNYVVDLYADGNPSATKSVNGLSTAFDVDPGHAYKATVFAKNAAGTSNSGRTSSESVAYNKSVAPTNVHEVGSDGDKSGTLGFTTPSDNGGYPVVKYRYTTQDGHSDTVSAPTQAKGASAQIAITFNTNHTDGQSVTLTSITEPPGAGDVVGNSVASPASFRPFGAPGAPSQTQSSGGYRSVTIGWNGGTDNGRPIEKTEIQGDASGSYGAGGGSVAIATAQGGEQKCIQVRSYAGGLWSPWSGNMCGAADARTLVLTFSSAPDQTAPCETNCKWISFSMSGFLSGNTYSYSTNIVPSGGGANVHGTVSTGGDGIGSKSQFAAFDSVVEAGETFCVFIDGVQACKTNS